MDRALIDELDVKKFNSFPANFAEAKHFFEERGFDISNIDHELIASGIEKVNKGVSLSMEEIQEFHELFHLGDTCGSESDHRLRGSAVSDEKINYSRT